MEIEVMTPEYLTYWLENKRWTFAKTAIKNPHYWIARKDNPPNDHFKLAFNSLEYWGEKERFWRWDYKIFYANGWKYWTMNTLDPTMDIINRASVHG